MKSMLIGITGGIGAGKTTVSRVLKELGYPVYDADSSAKHLLSTIPEIISSVKKVFGESAYVNEIPDRKFIASQVYNNKEKLEAINAIIHPAVAEHFKIWVNNHSDYKILFKEAAILFESGSAKEMDKVIAIDAPTHIRIQRIIQRDGRTDVEIKRIMESQLTSEELRAKSDYVIVNDEQQPLLLQIQSILNSIENSVKHIIS